MQRVVATVEFQVLVLLLNNPEGMEVASMSPRFKKGLVLGSGLSKHIKGVRIFPRAPICGYW